MAETISLKAQLAAAEEALCTSLQALRTHGRQNITWQFLKMDAARVADLKQQISNVVD